MNTEAALTGLDANEAVLLHNVITSEPGQIRTRRPIRIEREFFGSFLSPKGDVCQASMSLGSTMLTSWSPRQSSYGALEHGATRRSVNDPVDTLATAPAGNYGLIETRSPGSVVQIAVGSQIAALMPFGNTVNYDRSVYGVSTRGVATVGPFWSTSTMGTFAEVTEPRIVRWGGSTQTATVAATVTLNNGATSGTFGGTPPAASMVGMFIVDSGGSIGTGRNPAFGFQYVYQITSHVGGAAAFTIDKAFGQGGTVAQVPNLAAAACTLSPIVVLPMSPFNVGHVALHKDRLFAGQLWSTVVTASAPQGQSVNAIAWSKPGETSQWNSTNIAAVDDRSDEAVTGLVSVGNGSMLLIFKPTRTFALLGDSEDNFEIRLLSSAYGCVDARGIVTTDGGAVFPSEAGIVEFDGVRFRDITARRPGHGVRSYYLEALNGTDGTAALDKPRRRRVAAAATPDGYLLFSIQNDDTIGGDTTLPTGARSMLAYHRPTDAWTTWSTSADQLGFTGIYTGRHLVYDHFSTYADRPHLVYVPSSEGGIYRVDQCFAPTPTLDSTDASALKRSTFADLTAEMDFSITGVGSSSASTILAFWGTGILLPYDGDEFQITDLSLEFLRYATGTPADYRSPAPSSKEIRLWLKPDGQLIANRGGIFSNDGTGGITFVPPEHSVFSRNAGNAIWRDQRFFLEKTVLDRNTANHTLPMRCHSFQLGVMMDGSAQADLTSDAGSNPGARIYGVRLGLDGPSIQPGYDK